MAHSIEILRSSFFKRYFHEENHLCWIKYYLFEKVHSKVIWDSIFFEIKYTVPSKLSSALAVLYRIIHFSFDWVFIWLVCVCVFSFKMLIMEWSLVPEGYLSKHLTSILWIYTFMFMYLTPRHTIWVIFIKILRKCYRILV